MENYTLHEFMERLYEEQAGQLRFAAEDSESCRAWQERLRERLTDLIGWTRLEQIHRQWQPQLEARQHWERREDDGIRIARMSIQTFPGVRMPFYMLYPEGPVRGAMICLPAHGANKETVAGIADTQEAAAKLASTPLESYGREFARRGYLAICPDPCGYGERQERLALEDRSCMPDLQLHPLGTSCHKLSETAEALGLSLAGMTAWEMRRLIDYLQMRPEIRMSHLGCAGFSGGGMNTMWIAALDERIRLAVISGYIHGYRDSLLETHLCSCNYVPGLWNLVDVSDIASLIAPRPLFIENGLSDIENGPCGIQGPIRQVERIRAAYHCLGAEAYVQHSTPEGVHAWHATCYAFVDHYL